MRTVTAREANQNFSRLLAEVEGGETVVITRHGRPVAEFRPKPRDKREDPEWQAAQVRLGEALDEARRLADPDFRLGELTEDDKYGDRIRWPR
jgi:antitoxin (DNA-binding transcriptional repressor) of toxin-antitoxin stability system